MQLFSFLYSCVKQAGMGAHDHFLGISLIVFCFCMHSHMRTALILWSLRCMFFACNKTKPNGIVCEKILLTRCNRLSSAGGGVEVTSVWLSISWVMISTCLSHQLRYMTWLRWSSNFRCNQLIGSFLGYRWKVGITGLYKLNQSQSW